MVGRNRHGRPFGQAHRIRHARDRACFTHRDILAKGTRAGPEDRVAWSESRHLHPDRLDHAGEILTESHIGRSADAARQSHEIRLAAHVMPVERVGRRDVNAHEHHAVGGHGPRNGFALDDVRVPIAAIACGLHGDRARRIRFIRHFAYRRARGAAAKQCPERKHGKQPAGVPERPGAFVV